LKLIGDIALTGLFVDDYSKNDDRFKSIISSFKKCELIFANLECPIYKENSQNLNKSFIHTSNREVIINVLTKLKISCVSLANNHIYDCTMPGLKSTIETLQGMEVQFTGAGWRKEHIEPVILKEANQKIAFLAYVDKSTNPLTEKFPELLINYFEEYTVIEDVKKVRSQVDVVICSIHWGKDYSNYYTQKQQEQARALIEGGVDVIMGHHPHTVQSIEIYKNKIIFYSLGQLCFGDKMWDGKMRALKKKTKIGLIAELDPTVLDSPKIFGTREKEGNYLAFIKESKLRRKLKLFSLLNRWRFSMYSVSICLSIKESFIDRIYEYFFGYYRNPIVQLFSIYNFKKISFAIRDFKLLNKIQK